MNILHLIDHLGLGGAQTLVKGLMESQRDNDSVHLLALRRTTHQIEIDHPNVEICNATSKYSIRAFFRVRRLLRQKRIDIVHCHLQKSILLGWLVNTSLSRNTKLIIHEHGAIFTRNRGYEILLCLAARQADTIIAVSEAVRKALSQKMGFAANQTVVLYNAIDISRFDTKNYTWEIGLERQRLGMARQNFVVGFAARLIERKGWRDLLLAAQSISRQGHREIKFLVAGDGQDRASLIKQIACLDLGDSVTYVGHQSNMPLFYSLLDCLVVPSHWEPMGLTEIEAQASGIPVICADVPALNEIIRDGIDGLLFNPSDHLDLAKQILKLSGDPDLCHKLAAAGTAAVQRFKFDHYTPRLAELYNRLPHCSWLPKQSNTTSAGGTGKNGKNGNGG